MAQVFGFDAETSSPVDLRLHGADAYTRHPETRCLMLAFKLIGSAERPRLWTEGDPFPYELYEHIVSGGLLSGWNVIGFDRLVYERILVPRHGFPPIDSDAWKDSMHLAVAANLPRSLDGCAKAVGVEHQADLKDSNRIRRVTDAKRTPIPAPVAEILDNPDHFDKKLVEDLQWLADRCVQDVAMEEQVLIRLPAWPSIRPWAFMPAIDRRINDRGVMIDVPLVEGLAKAAALETLRINEEMRHITGGVVSKVSNIESLKQWLMGRGVELPRANTQEDEDDEADEGEEEESSASRKSPWRLRKNDIADLMGRLDVPEDCRLALGYRAEAAKASTAKLKAMLSSVGADGRLRGHLTLGGAQQTMRWSGSRWQAHNLVRDVYANPDEIAETNGLDVKKDAPEVKRLAEVALRTGIEVGRRGDPDLMRSLYQTIRRDAQKRDFLSGVIHWISRMLRRTICALQGRLLLNGDYAQIEARITVWLSQQLDMLHAYATGQDVYRVAASGIYGIPPEALSKAQRQAGKVTILACGFGGAEGALVAMGVNYGLLMSKEEGKPIVQAWRAANQATVKYWYAVDDAAAAAVMCPGREFHVPPLGLVSYFCEGDCLCARLPTGRILRYWAPRLRQEYWADGKPKNRLSLSGLTVKGKAVFRRSLYHTILVENQVQAIGADLLAIALENADSNGLPVVLHVHDSVAGEVDEDKAESLLPLLEHCMTDMPAWTKGLPVNVDADASARFG